MLEEHTETQERIEKKLYESSNMSSGQKHNLEDDDFFDKFSLPSIDGDVSDVGSTSSSSNHRTDVGLGSSSALGAGAGSSSLSNVGIGTTLQPRLKWKSSSSQVDFIISAHGVVATDKDYVNVPENIILYSNTSLKAGNEVVYCSTEESYLKNNMCQLDLSNLPSTSKYTSTTSRILEIKYSHGDDFPTGVYDCKEGKLLERFKDVPKADWTLSYTLNALSHDYPNQKINVYHSACTAVNPTSASMYKKQKVQHQTHEQSGVKTKTVSNYTHLYNNLSQGSHVDFDDLIYFFVEFYTKHLKSNTDKNIHIIKITLRINTHALNILTSNEDSHEIDKSLNDINYDSSLKHAVNVDNIYKSESIRTICLLIKASLRKRYEVPHELIYIIDNSVLDTTREYMQGILDDTKSNAETKKYAKRIKYYIDFLKLYKQFRNVYKDDLLKIPKISVLATIRNPLVQKIDPIKSELSRDRSIEDQQSHIETLTSKINSFKEEVDKAYNTIMTEKKGGRRRTYRRSVKKRTKTIRRKNK